MPLGADALRLMMDFGLSQAQIIQLFDVIAGPYSGPPPKRYGPLQHQDLYWSDEKARVYAVGLAHVDLDARYRLPANWNEIVETVLRRDNRTCTYCGASGPDFSYHCDHVVPRSRGGSNELENLTTACEFCNCSKHNRLPHEWRPTSMIVASSCG